MIMNRFILTSLFLAAVCSASAQKVNEVTTVEENEDGRIETTVTTDKFKVETNYFFDNWFMSVGVGTQVYMGDNDKFMQFKDRLTPAIDFSVGKWFSPGLGLQVSYSGYKINGLWWDGYAGQHWKTETEYTNPRNKFTAGGKLYEQEAKFFNIHVEGLVNLSNLFGGYKERVYSCIPYVGVGWIRSYDHPGKNVDDLSFNAGIINSFRLSNALSLNLTLRGGIMDDGFDGEISGVYYQGPSELEPEGLKGGGQNYNFDGYGGVTLGLTYRFKQRGWDKARSVEAVYSNDKYIARLQNEIEQLKNRPAVVAEPVIVTVPQEVVITFPYLVNFVINHVEVVNRERVNLGFVADMIKAFPQKKFLVSGYADQYTGSKERNTWLAENRAKNVYKVLTEEFGVPVEQLVVGSHGGVDNMFYNDPQLSRSVVITEYGE